LQSRLLHRYPVFFRFRRRLCYRKQVAAAKMDALI
jgi:hypothetical protein